MIGVVHAYSRTNLGDGLLVDLTMARLARQGVRPSDVRLLALDPASFPEFDDVVAVGVPGRRADRHLARAALTAGVTVLGSSASRRGFSWGELGTGVADLEAIVGVGGAYLRSGTLVEQLGIAVNHLPQLCLAAAADVPTLYLPQSIGPLQGPVGALTRRYLARIDQVLVRDPQSRAEVPGKNVTEMPDLAVLAIAEEPPSPVATGGPVMAIGRFVDESSHLRLRRLSELMGGDARWAVQTTGAVEKSDAAYYSSLGVASAGSTTEVLSGPVSAGVSVRLHGALMAIGAGVPTVHLAYQRKGWAAMHQLGLSEYVHDASSFNPATVALQCEQLSEDPAGYWRAIERAQPVLRQKSAELDRIVEATVGSGRS